ncbi:hypothetical protein ACFY9A_39955 [Streptomyces rubradiris]|uniref:hypothetical protein n=1 Tax=Streptomyces rubradiris TaxID=285531 RepID=UPI0036ECB3A7
MRQALDLDHDPDYDSILTHPRPRPGQPPTPQPHALREAVERLKADEACGEFHHPDQQLADRIEELAATR